MFGGHHHDHPLVAGDMPRVDLLAEVLFSHAVDKGQAGVVLNGDDIPTDLQIAIGVVRVDNRDGNARVALQIAILLALRRLAKP